MASKSEGHQFLLNIKPKYRKTVSPILQMLKKNREASDFVCQAILEKVQRDGLSTIEHEVENILEEKGIPLSFSSPQTTSTRQTSQQTQQTMIAQQEASVAKEETSTVQEKIPHDIQVVIDDKKVEYDVVKTTPIQQEKEITEVEKTIDSTESIKQTEEEKKEISSVSKPEVPETEPKQATKETPSFNVNEEKPVTNTIKQEPKINIGKQVNKQSNSLGSSLFDLD